MSLALLFHYLMLNMFRMLIHPSSEACDLFVELFQHIHPQELATYLLSYFNTHRTRAIQPMK